MKPVSIYSDDDIETLRRKMVTLVDDIYSRFYRLQEEVINFDTGENLVKTTTVAVDSDQSDVDIAAHEAAYDHNQLHARQHAIDSTNDHTSTIVQDNIMDADANGLPDDSGYSIADVLDCDNHTSGTTNFVLIQQAAEADLSQTISDPPTQAEVQAISDKIDALLTKLRSANVLAT